MIQALCRALAILLLALAPGAQAAPPSKAPPSWAELTTEQQQVLAPLQADWESLEAPERRKWIGIAKRYPRMDHAAQERVQRRMQTWANLTPEQRRQARENYKKIAKVRAEKRAKLREQWTEYQALPPQERQSLVPPEAPKAKRARQPKAEKGSPPAGK